jgi:hypothetical protein
MIMKFRSRAILVACSAAAVVLPVAASASAATVSAPLVTGLAGPLGLAVGSGGTVYVSQAFSSPGLLTAVGGRGTRTVAEEPGAEITGVDANGAGTVVYTTTAFGDEGATAAFLKRVLPNGRSRTLADVLAYERQNNPDSGSAYAFQDLEPGCAEELPPEIPDPYAGIIDSHPYSVATVPGGWVVGDAAGNDLLRVSPNGRVSTLAVLPPQPVTITAEMAAEFGLDSCVVGATYNAEAVPTDVELGPDGMLYVSTLAGDPAPGSVYRVDPSTGAYTRIATGFAGATGVAVAPDGTIYVAELFGGAISKAVNGAPETFAELPFPAAVEWANGKLYATIDVFQFVEGQEEPILGDGKVVMITP